MQYKCKRIIAAVLCIAMVAGFAGCDNSKKSKEQISAVMDSYIEALKDLDADAILELTNWEDDDKNFLQLKEQLDYATIGQNLYDYEAYIASTIDAEYDPDAIEVDGKKATAVVDYELVAWEKIYNEEHDNYDEVLEELKSNRKTVNVEGKVSLELEDGKWVITKLSKLDDVFEYTYNSPLIWAIDPTEPTYDTDPTDTEPEPSGTAFADSYDRAIEGYIDLLYMNEDALRATEDTFGDGSCCIFDIDGNGIPELLTVTTENGEFCDYGTLNIYSYNEYAGEVQLTVQIPDIIYTAAGGGCFMVWTTADELIITYEHGEESLYSVETSVYMLDLSSYLWAFKRDSSLEYDSDADDYYYSYTYYWDEEEVGVEYYASMINYYVESATLVIVANYEPVAGDYEYPLSFFDQAGFMIFDDALSVLERDI